MPALATLFARQPIHDRNSRVAGFELLFRASGDTCAVIGDPNSATADVVTRALLDVGLEPLVGRHPAWINIARDFIVNRTFEALPPRGVVLEVLESVRAEPEVLAALRAARRAGFEIALDDFEVRSDTQALMDECDYIKLDCCGRDTTQMRAVLGSMGRVGPTLLAEKVESREMFEACAEAGASLFQGYYFARPEPVHGAPVTTDRLRLMRVVAELNHPDVSIERVAELVQTDVGLAYRLLRYANSADLSRARVFEHVSDAITMLGLDRVRACATLLALSGVSAKPPELARMALVRARYCQRIGEARHGDAQKHFAAGLFSVLDAYLNESMQAVVDKLPLDKDLAAALIERTGALGAALDATIACEQADWRGAALEGIDDDELASSYLEALAWADSMQAGLETT